MKSVTQLLTLLITFIFNTHIKAQRITPLTFNNGGGYSSTMEWSLGESVSIASFSSGTFKLNTGVLQPLSNAVTAISNFGPDIFADQVSIGPNPTSNHLYIKAKFLQPGKVTIQINDSRSAVVFTEELERSTGIYEKDIQLQGFASGNYYLRIYFKPILGTPNMGIYKIIKL